MEHAKTIFDFFVGYILIKVIIGHWVADQFVTLAKKWFATTDRKQAIWLHYQSKASGKSHQNDNVLTCGQEHCQIFSAPIQLAQPAR